MEVDRNSTASRVCQNLSPGSKKTQSPDMIVLGPTCWLPDSADLRSKRPVSDWDWGFGWDCPEGRGNVSHHDRGMLAIGKPSPSTQMFKNRPSDLL